MRHVKDKDDWHYEFRPHMIVAFGLLGIFAHSFTTTPGLAHICQICGVVLLILAFNIFRWRQAHRKGSW